MSLLNEIPVIPPLPDMPHELKLLRDWLVDVSAFIDIREKETDEVVNGLIEWPTPFEGASGNVRVHYQILEIEAADLAGPMLTIPHDLGYTPRIWFYQSHSPGLWLTDQVVDFNNPSPTVPGYVAADVTAPGTVQGGAAVLNGWSGNGVRLGDQLFLTGDTGFRRIASITAGTPDQLSVEPDTSLPVAAGYRYFIRRPMDAVNLYLRPFSHIGDGGFVTLAIL